MTQHTIAFFVALAAFVYNEYIDPWTVSADREDIWAMREAMIAFDAWERSVGGVHPDACVCLFCRQRPSLVDEPEAEVQEGEPSEEEEVVGFLDATDMQALLRSYKAKRP